MFHFLHIRIWINNAKLTDIYTGIMLELAENAYNGKNEHTYFTSLEIDVPIAPVTFDPTGYEKQGY